MKKIFSYIAILLGILFTIPVGIIIFSEGIVSLNIAIMCHILSALLLSFGFFVLTGKHKLRERQSNIWWTYALVVTFLLPLFGALNVLIVYLSQSLKATRPPPILEDQIDVPNAEVFAKTRKMSRQLEILDRLDIEPFVDIFRRGQTDLKKSAVKLLGAMKTKKSIKTLMLALLDDDIEIRLCAAGILSKIEDEFAIDIKDSSTHYEEKRGDTSLGLKLVNTYLEYAEIGLLDKIAGDYYYREMIKVLNDLPEKDNILYLKALACFALDKNREAKELIDQCLVIDKNNGLYNELNWKILFAEKAFTELHKDIMIAKKTNMQGVNSAVLEFWG